MVVNRVHKKQVTGKGGNLLLFPILFHLFILLSSCLSEEKETGVRPSPPVDEARSLTLTIQIPGTSIPVTYALNPDAENAIQTIDVLVFRVADDGVFFHEHIPVEKVIQPGTLSSIKQFGLTLEDIDARLVVLANVRHLFNNSLLTLLDEATQKEYTKEEVMSYFIFDFSMPWNTGQLPGDILPFPMYGESDIIRRTDTGSDEIKMKRSICRIDIGVASAGAFEIDSVFIFYANNKGYVAPAFDSYGTILEKPNIPSSTSANTKYFTYKYEANNEKGMNLMESTIYITEDTQNSEKPTTLVIKASQQGADMQYYRINLKDKEGYSIPFIRNYRYRIVVTGISGEGYLSAREAAEAPTSLPSLIDANELELRAVEFNDHYLLGLGTDYILLEDEKAFTLDVYTTYNCWSAAWKDGQTPSWIGWTNTNGENAGNGETVFSSAVTALGLKITENPLPEVVYRATLIIRAGTLAREVTITYQTKQEDK